MANPRATGNDPYAALDASLITVALAQRQMLEAIVAIERSGLWRKQGSRTLAGWLAARLGTDAEQARDLVRAARQLRRRGLAS